MLEIIVSQHVRPDRAWHRRQDNDGQHGQPSAQASEHDKLRHRVFSPLAGCLGRPGRHPRNVARERAACIAQVARPDHGCIFRRDEPTARLRGLEFFRAMPMSVTEATLARLPRGVADGDWTWSVALFGTSAGGDDMSTIVGGSGVSSHSDTPLFIAQIAACVRLCTLILRRIALTWTF